MELTEERVREIVREEVSQMREEWKKSHTWDGFIRHLEESRPDLLCEEPRN